MIKVAIINIVNDECLENEFKKLFLTSNYKIDFVNISLSKLTQKLKHYSKLNIPTIVFCGKELPTLKNLLPKNAYNASLISPGDNNDNLLLSFFNDSNLKNFSYIGYQGFRNNPDNLYKLSEKYFEGMRLGGIRDDIRLVEPLLRNAEHIFIDMRSVKYSDFPYSLDANPNGLYAEEICTIAGYIGWSEQLQTVYIYGADYDYDKLPICNKLIAEVVWHVCEGVSHNRFEQPFLEISNDFIKKIVSMGDQGQDITFVFSVNTHRWWMEITCLDGDNPIYIPCSEIDYKKACEGRSEERRVGTEC